MANLKEIRNRISSVSSTRQITSAMKMVSASKLKKAQDKVLSLRPYADKLKEIIADVSPFVDEDVQSAYSEIKKVDKVLIIAISSNRGLCGAFNANIGKKIDEIKRTTYKDIPVEVLAIGKKINDIALKKYSVVANHSELLDDIILSKTSEIAEWVMKSFVEGNYGRIYIVYNKFKNAASQIVMHEQFLPIEVEEIEGLQSKDYISEPSMENIMTDIIPTLLKIQLHNAVLDSNAAEHGARMTSMHKATDNATDLINELNLTYNKARQASITNEILEIVGGAEALKG